jgi:hypothetical protein
VALTLEDGPQREFLIGRSEGWLPVHLAKIDENDPGVPLRRLEFTPERIGGEIVAPRGASPSFAPTTLASRQERRQNRP